MKTFEAAPEGADPPKHKKQNSLDWGDPCSCKPGTSSGVRTARGFQVIQEDFEIGITEFIRPVTTKFLHPRVNMPACIGMPGKFHPMP